MRLIDADSLKEQIESHVVSMPVCLNMGEHYGKVTMKEDCLEDIRNAPTIDAIPVEWLRNVHKNWILSRDDIEFRDWLIEKWQKEQEAQDG